MDETNNLENTGFLLQRLQELKNWQKQQEEQLLKEQQLQLDQLLHENRHILEEADVNYNNDGGEDIDDDTTIDQDLSSLQSEAIQSLPSWATGSRSRFLIYLSTLGLHK